MPDMTTASTSADATPVVSSRASTRAKIAGPTSPETPYPLRMSGTVIKGFGRGSKELGIPTANLPEESIAEQEKEMVTGIYYGWAQVVAKDSHQNSGTTSSSSSSAASSTSSLALSHPATVYPMVMSLGWNPFYKNEKKSAEVHIMHKFHRDFYGDDLRVIVLGYIRPELDYTTLEALIEDINIDIEVAHRSLERPDYAIFKQDPIFAQN